MTRALVLEEPERVPDGCGGFAVTWIGVGTLWASVVARRGREAFVAGRTEARVTYRILVRGAPPGARSRPRADQRFREGSRIFDIVSVAEADPRGRFLEIIAEEGRMS
ncbi:head-tail adaptor protein [Amaricoccus solimangrovi]|uniref:Head-tail adaptor protein n=1 Tax=Amaricoccus solimangrovi TaxID=2589815 RepID=A0A501WM06_9RHOB|nr:head-tail adaptor protein [Amaricoccus solimangrovi]